MTVYKTKYNCQDIQRRLPHRYPFLMIDRIEESGPGYAIGCKNVTINEPFFQGHFPDFPVMPGALITEACLQASAFIGAVNPGNADECNATNTRLICAGFDMKFTGLVTPGDQLRINVRHIRQVGNLLRVKVRVTSQSGTVATGDLSLATQPDRTAV